MTNIEKELIIQLSKEGYNIVDWKHIDGHELPITKKSINLANDETQSNIQFTKDELQHIKDSVESSFRGIINNNCYHQGEYALNLEISILSKLKNKVDNIVTRL